MKLRIKLLPYSNLSRDTLRIKPSITKESNDYYFLKHFILRLKHSIS